MVGMKRRIGALGLVLAAIVPASAAAAWGSDVRPSESRGSPAPDDGAARALIQHRMMIGRQQVGYSSEVGRIAIRDVETGIPHGYIFYTAYRVASTGAPRPITFVWNGGPGADSATLHFHVAGPKRLVGDALVDNAQSWLGATDLVFVDPVGTGFSRPAEARFADEFYGTIGDVASVTEFVRVWRLMHAAEDAPLFLAGESWGAGRAASVGEALATRGIAVAGLILISGGAGLKQEPVPPALAAALRIVDWAETGRFHGRVAPADAQRLVVEAWARGVYAPALERAGTLSDAERDAIVAGLSRYTGLPAGRIDRRTLRITPRALRTGLLADQGKTLGVFDMRQTSPAPEGAGAAAITRYLRHDLGYLTAEPYVGLEPVEQGYAPTGNYPVPVGERWNYATATVTPEERAAAMAAAQASGAGPPRLGPPLPGTNELLAIEPGVRILVAAGRYDSLNSCAVNDEIARRLAATPAAAIRFRCYGGGHMMYGDEDARIAISRDVADLVSRR